ncbi:MAG: hypothetical protein ACTSXG_03170 [Alphaproteobacteria bacterium]
MQQVNFDQMLSPRKIRKEFFSYIPPKQPLYWNENILMPQKQPTLKERKNKKIEQKDAAKRQNLENTLFADQNPNNNDPQEMELEEQNPF